MYTPIISPLKTSLLATYNAIATIKPSISLAIDGFFVIITQSATTTLKPRLTPPNPEKHHSTQPTTPKSLSKK